MPRNQVAPSVLDPQTERQVQQLMARRAEGARLAREVDPGTFSAAAAGDEGAQYRAHYLALLLARLR